MRQRKGFSLVELLTVIGIIALLLALLLPVLTKARSEAVKVKCMSNLRNLLQAQSMYVAENKGFLTYPNWSVNLEATNNWSIGWLYTQERTSDPLQQNDVKTGALYHYLNDTKVYHCPTHVVDNVPAGWTERLTSYIMNGAVCGYGTVGDHNADPEIWVPSWKITDWKNSAEQILWWEAEENSDIPGAVAWNDGSSYPYENALAKRHGRGASVGCFDGHVEWMDRIDFLTEYQKPGPNRLYCDPHRADGGHSPADARQ
jgi:prepilin-type N-terminal cleavage/methylation domain-containing protein/prepilin-type processing-associated H-X9-DG protein